MLSAPITLRRLPSSSSLRLIGLAIVLLSISPASGAHADEPVKQNAPTSYDDLIDRALLEFKLGHWTEARVYFADAHALQPNARTLRGLGLACYEARNYVEAINFLEQALVNQQQPLTPTMRDECSALLQQARQFVSTVTLEVDPANAEILLDSKPIQRGADGRILLDPGKHDLLVRARGFEPATQTLTAEGGGPLHTYVHLEPFEPNNPPTAPRVAPFVETPSAQQAATAGQSTANPIGPWIVIGASGAVLVASAIFLGVAVTDKSIAEHPDDRTTWAEARRATSQGRAFFPLGFVLLGTGLAGVAAGSLWKLWPSLTEREDGANVYLTPSGVVVSGRL